MTTSTGRDAVVEVVQVAGLAISTMRAGSGDRVVFFHHSFGNPGWLAVHDLLATSFEVDAPDLPGFGASARPSWARDPRDLALVMGHYLRRTAESPVTAVGCGFGAWVAAELATMDPGLFSHLILVGGAGILPEDGSILDQMLTSHHEYVRAAFSNDAAYEDVYGTELGDDLLLAWDLNREMTTRVAWKPYMYNRRLLPLLGEVPIPTLVVWGELDRVVPRSCATAYVASLPNARLELVPGCGHAVDLERPDVLAALVRDHLATT